MKRRTLLSVLAGWLLCMPLAPLSAQGRERLIVENRSGGDVDVYVWRYNGTNWDWTFVAKVGAGFGVPISDVHENERFRAWLHARSEQQYHTVRFTGASDGAAEDRWPID